jgi:hypothetical protein
LSFWLFIDLYTRNPFLIIFRVESIFYVSFWRLCLDNVLCIELQYFVNWVITSMCIYDMRLNVWP